MLGRIDYSKWDKVESDDDQEDPDDFENVHTGEQRKSRAVDNGTMLEQLATMKAQCDDYFRIAGKSKDPHDYKVAIYDGYMKMLHELDFIDRKRMDESHLSQLRDYEISCRLNCTACFLKLSQWEEAIDECSTLLSLVRDDNSVTTLKQKLRGHYFRSHAHLMLDTKEGLSRSIEDAAQVKALLDNNDIRNLVVAGGAGSVTDYNHLFEMIRDVRLKFDEMDNKELLKAKQSDLHTTDLSYRRDNHLVHAAKNLRAG
jgi:hypothetical protein